MARRYSRDDMGMAKALYLGGYSPREVAQRLTATIGVSTPEALIFLWATTFGWDQEATLKGQERSDGLPFDIDEDLERVNRDWADYEALKRKGLEGVAVLEGVPALRAARIVDIAIRGQRSFEAAKTVREQWHRLIMMVKEEVNDEEVMKRISKLAKKIFDEYQKKL